MKKILLYIFASCIGIASFGQNRAAKIKSFEKINGVVAPKPHYQGENASIDNASNLFTSPNNTVNARSKAVGSEAYIGTTRYDLQTNNSQYNRIIKVGNSISAVWTRGINPTTYADRGTGYNYSGDNGGTWGSIPTARIENVRTGFTNVCNCNGKEVVIAHTGTGMSITSRPTIGSGPWTTNIIPGSDTLTGMTWPHIACSGNNIHIFVSEPNVASGGQLVNGLDGALFYFRSTDGGITWDKRHLILPGLDSASYLGLQSDQQDVDAYGNIVAMTVAPSTFGSDVVLFKSIDNGANWTKTIVNETGLGKYDPLAAGSISDIDSDGIADPIYDNDGTVNCVIDYDGIVHVAWGFTKVMDDDPALDAGTTWWPYMGAICYWNDTMATVTDSLSYYRNTVAFPLDETGNGTISFTDLNGGDNNLGNPNYTYRWGYYRNHIVSFPSMAVDPEGGIALMYNSVRDSVYNSQGLHYRNTFLTCFHADSINGTDAIFDLGKWSAPENITPSDFDEYAYTTQTRRIANGDTLLYFISMKDGSPGTNIGWNTNLGANPHPVVLNDIVYNYASNPNRYGTFVVSPSIQNVAAIAGTTNFIVTTSGSWTAVSNQTWCTVTPSGTGNGTITATFTANTGAARTANITVSSPGLTDVIVTVSQATGMVSTLSVNPANQNVANNAGSTTFSVTSNISWTAVSNQTWCVVTPSGTGNGTITAFFTANTGAARTANITVSGSGVTDVIVTVSQAAGSVNTLSVAPSNQNVSAIAGSTTFTVTSNISWTAVSNQTWCVVTPSGTGNGTITAFYTANTGAARTANITVSGSGVTDVIVTVSQAAAGASFLNVTPANQNVTAPAGSTTFTVTSDTSWTVSCPQSWCTVTPASGLHNGTITANYTANTGVARVANITVTAPGLAPVIVTVTQAAGAANFMTVTPATQNVTLAAGSTSFTVSSSVSWTAVSNQTWCTITPASGTGNGSVTANYTANTGSERTATITFTGTGVPNVTVTVVQASFIYMNITPDHQDVSAIAGITSFAVSSNTAWTVTSNQTWCTLNPAFGSGDVNVYAIYTANTATTQRTATLTFAGTGVSNKTVTVIQDGVPATLDVTPATSNITATAGTVHYTVTSNITWTAVSSQAWCTLSPASGNNNGSFNATVTANTGAARSATITISGGGATPVAVTINQDATGGPSVLTVDPTAANVTALPGSVSLNVSSNIAWTAVSSQTWANLTPLSGTGNGSVTVSYGMNTGTARTANITFSGAGVPDVIVPLNQDAPAPSITVTPIILADFGNVNASSFSSAQTYTLSGTSLIGDIYITRPVSDFQISEDGTDWSNVAITVSPSAGNISNKIIYVRFAPSSAGVKTGTINHTSPGAVLKTVTANGNGTVSQPQITISSTALDLGIAKLTKNKYKHYQIQGAFLSDTILVSSSNTSFKLSLDSAGNVWTNSVVLNKPVGATVTPTIIYIRFTPAAVGAINGLITHKCTGATQQTLAVTGTGEANAGVDEISATNQELIAYPNPSNGLFQIKYMGEEMNEVSLEIYSGKGTRIYLNNIRKIKDNENLTIDLAGATPGIYYIKLSSKKKIITRKIVVM